MKYLIAIIAVEAIVEIFMESALFEKFRSRIGNKHLFLDDLMNCSWCISVWVAGLVFVFVCIGLWWLLIPIAVHRASNYLHDIDGLIKRSGWRK